jgi:hypothetical protein
VVIGGNLLAAPKDVSKAFGENLSMISRGNVQSARFAHCKRLAERRPLSFTGGENENYNAQLTITEYRSALSTCGNTAAGPDGVHYSMLKNVTDATSDYILDLFNRIWHEKVFPTSWKLAIVLPFKKQNKDGKDINNYRPISLTSCACKLMEKVVNNRLVWYLEAHSLLAPEQYGFRKFKSTTDVLVRLETYIREAFANKKHVYAIFFDMEKAYDITWRRGILQSLHNTGLRGRLPEFVRNFLQDRKIVVRIAGTLSDEFPQFEGVPQGSVISATLFALAINGLPSILPAYVSSTLYVDDFAIFSTSNSLTVLQRRMQVALNNTNRWIEEHGFKVSIPKTKLIHFTRRRGPFQEPSLTMDNFPLPLVEEVRFLGLTFDRKLTWVAHIKDLKVRCLKTLDLLKCISGQKWGADRLTLLRIYRALVRSKLDYGCQAYASATPSALKMLDVVHHAGIRLATGAFRTSPVESLYVESGEPSLSSRRDKLSLQLYARLQRQPNTLTSIAVNSHSDSLDALYEQSTTLRTPYGYRVRKLILALEIEAMRVLPVTVAEYPPWILPPIECCKGITSHMRSNCHETELHALFAEHQAEHNNTVPIYTDGSKSDGGAGWAAVFPATTVSGKLPIHASVFSAELSAIISALEHIAEQPQAAFTIYSDSLLDSGSSGYLQRAATCTESSQADLRSKSEYASHSNLLLGPCARGSGRQ